MLSEKSLDKHDEKASPESRLLQLITGNWPMQAVYAAAKLELADHVHDGPKTVEELAIVVGAHAPSLQRLLLRLGQPGRVQGG